VAVHRPGSRWPARLTGPLCLALAAACSGGAAPLNPGSAPPSSPPDPAVSSLGAVYTATGLDLCGRTDLTVLSDLALTVDRRDPTPPTSGPGAACRFELHAATGQPATVLVEAITLASVADAQSLYRAAGRATALAPDRAVNDLGDEADGFSQQSEPTYTEYLLVARDENLVVTVALGVGGTTAPPSAVDPGSATLADRAKALAGATLAAVPRN
jgi:hypothetical protein